MVLVSGRPSRPMLVLVLAIRLLALPVASAQEAATTIQQPPETTTTTPPPLLPQQVDDRSWLDVFGEAAKEYLTQELIPPTDAACQWDWRVARCEPYCHCHFRSAWGDYHLGRSCRKRLHDDVVCGEGASSVFDPARMLEYEQEEDTATTKRENPNAAQQALVTTVKALQWSRDRLQKATVEWKAKSVSKYEEWQDHACAAVADSCVPSSGRTWKERVFCRETLCEEEEEEEATNKAKTWKDKLMFWKKPNNNEDPEEEVASSSSSSYYLPEWSTASDWSAGVAIETEAPIKKKKKKRPRVSPTRRITVNGSEANMDGIDTAAAAADGGMAEKDGPSEEDVVGQGEEKAPNVREDLAAKEEEDLPHETSGEPTNTIPAERESGDPPQGAAEEAQEEATEEETPPPKEETVEAS